MGIFSKISTGGDVRSARLAGVGLMLAGVFMFSFGDALGKYVVATYSVGQLLLLRGCAALALLSPMIWRNRVKFLQLERPWLQLLRVMFGVVVFGDVPSPATLVGAAIIIAAGLYIFLREQALGRSKAVISPPV
jgi:drug/metabolite transporter (DMT)-like permease